DTISRSLQAESAMQVCSLWNSDGANRIPELMEGPRLARSKKREIRLIVGVHTCHQLDVWTGVVGETAVPGIAELMIAPRPLLLSRRDVVVCHVHHTRLHGVVVPSKEVFFG